MSATDSISAIFFEECEDLLEALSEGLASMAGGDQDTETLNAVFRAVHSVKGGAGAFGLDDLVGFAHSFETVLDSIRSDKLEPDDELVRLLQKSGDVLADLVEAARDDTPIDAAVVATTTDALEAVLGEGGSAEEEFVFESIAADFDLDLALDVDTATTYQISFVPERDLYTFGHEPAVLIAALCELGEATVTPDISRLPHFDSFDWEESYVSWDITLVSSATERDIQEVFEFAEGSCELTISAQTPESDFPDGLPDLGGLPDLDGPEDTDTPELNAEEATQEAPAVAEASPSQAAAGADRKKGPRATLRVDVDRIDRLINTVGELIINQAMISQRVRELGVNPGPELVTDLIDYKQLARDIQEGVMGLRTQPVKQLFQRMARIARDSADVAGKKSQLIIEGEETEVDKKVIEKLSDPLTHMIRNAIDHGLESPEKRLVAGKPELGTVRLTASYKSGDVLIQISDDGAGLNRPRIRQIAIDRGLIPEDADLSETEIDNLLFQPGFSTASSVTNLSGRGVGMDVVKTAITSLGGRISISSTPGEGSIFSISLPLTLAVLDGMVVRVGAETMVVPIACIEESVRPRKRDLSPLGAGRLLFACRGDYVPVIDLGARLGQPPQGNAKAARKTLLLIQSNGARAALSVDGVVDKRQVVIKSLAKNYRQLKGISAATILGDGKVALIVDPDGITDDPPPVVQSFAPSKSTPKSEDTGHAA